MLLANLGGIEPFLHLERYATKRDWHRFAEICEVDPQYRSDVGDESFALGFYNDRAVQCFGRYDDDLWRSTVQMES